MQRLVVIAGIQTDFPDAPVQLAKDFSLVVSSCDFRRLCGESWNGGIFRALNLSPEPEWDYRVLPTDFRFMVSGTIRFTVSTGIAKPIPA